MQFNPHIIVRFTGISVIHDRKSCVCIISVIICLDVWLYGATGLYFVKI